VVTCEIKGTASDDFTIFALVVLRQWNIVTYGHTKHTDASAIAETGHLHNKLKNVNHL